MKRIIFAILCLACLTAKADHPQITWQDNSNNEDGFYITRSLNGNSSGIVGRVGPNVTTWADMYANVDEYPNYRWIVYAYRGTPGQPGYEEAVMDGVAAAIQPDTGFPMPVPTATPTPTPTPTRGPTPSRTPTPTRSPTPTRTPTPTPTPSPNAVTIVTPIEPKVSKKGNIWTITIPLN